MSPEHFIPLYERIESIQISKRYLYTRIHSSIIHIIQKVEPIQMLVNRYTNKMCYRHTTEYYPPLKEGIPTRATTWVNVEDIKLSTMSQEDQHFMLPRL